ncbi:MAG: hypothetical protein N2489_08090 [Clostridia bacterium]|nr:hypothetical protein [Clostridia bacterium]
MVIIYIRKYKLKAAIILLVFVLLITCLFLSGPALKNNLKLNITINDCLEFSYPISFEVDNIYVNEAYSHNTIQTNSNMKKPSPKKFTSYKSLEGKISFSYPSAFSINQEVFSGSEILYHIEFRNKSGTNHGFVQIWNLPYSLKDFLKNSQSTSSSSYKYFKSSEISINGIPGFYWDYVAATGNDIKIKGQEVFLKKDSRMYRISYFVPESRWNKEQSVIFWHMANSFKVY